MSRNRGEWIRISSSVSDYPGHQVALQVRPTELYVNLAVFNLLGSASFIGTGSYPSKLSYFLVF